MKRYCSIVVALHLLFALLPVPAATAAVGDIYPAANMGDRASNPIFDAIWEENGGAAGAIEQTSAVWRYQYAPIGDFSESAYQDYAYQDANHRLQRDETNSIPRQIIGSNLLTGNNHDAVMTFIAPEDGLVEISNANTNHVVTAGYTEDDTDRSDGVQIQILKGETQIWPQSGWAQVAPSVTQDVIYQQVSAGDRIHFRVNKNQVHDNDGTWWNPTVRYVESLYFEQEQYYTTFVTDNEGTSYDAYNLVTIAATKPDGIAGDVVYQSLDTDILVPTANPAEFQLLKEGTATIQATLMQGGSALAEATATVNVSLNNVGGPYDYAWNGATTQGPVWYYKALVPAGAATSAPSDYQELDRVARNDKYGFFTIDSASDYGYIRTDNRMHPGLAGSPTLAFRAPKDGTVKIGALSGLYPQLIDVNSTDGIRYRIAHNEEIIYPASGGFQHIPKEQLNQPDNYGEIYVDVQEGDFLYFTLDANQEKTGDMSAWSPTVTYVPTSFMPNPLGLTDTISVAPSNPATDGGVQTDDSLQLAYQLDKADITVSGANSTQPDALVDATGFHEAGGDLTFDGSGTIDIVFNDTYTGSRSIEDLSILLHSTGGSSATFSVDVYYTTTTAPDTLIELYSAAEIRSQTFDSAYPYIRLRDFDGKVSDLHKLHLVINDRMENTTTIAEIDLNMAADDADVVAKRAELQKEVKLPTLFSDNMMLQRDKPINIWGYGGTESVLVELIADGQTVRSGTAQTADGKWSIALDSLPGGHTVYQMRVTDTSDESNQVTVENILIGDIWIATGQSNMDFNVENIDSRDQDIKEAVYDEIRYFNQRTMGAMTPLEDSYFGTWSEAVGETIDKFSAVAYHFARELYEQTDKEIPIGILAAKMSGTRIQAWVSEEFLNSDPDFAAVNNLHTYDVYQNPSNPASYAQRAAAPYNALVHPLIGMNIKGAIWYQGEENSFQPEFYKKIFPALIAERRSEFRDEDMPFYFVQLPSFGNPPSNGHWPEMREVQLQTALTVPNTGMVVTTDLGEKDDIHPTNKRPVGQRLAYAVAAQVYGKDIPYSGPLYDTVTVEEDKVIVHFTHTEDGLVAQTRNPDYQYGTDDPSEEFIPSEDGMIHGFELSADGATFTPAEARIVGDTVEVTGVENPVALRFGWSNYAEPELNLFNSANLPASPFRVLSFDAQTAAPSIEITNNEATVSGSIVNHNLPLLNPVVILATYQADGALHNVQMHAITAALGETTEYQFTISVPAGGKVSAFLWNNLTDMVPLTPKASADNAS